MSTGVIHMVLHHSLTEITFLSIQTLNDDKLNNYHDDITNAPICPAASTAEKNPQILDQKAMHGFGVEREKTPKKIKNRGSFYKYHYIQFLLFPDDD